MRNCRHHLLPPLLSASYSSPAGGCPPFIPWGLIYPGPTGPAASKLLLSWETSRNGDTLLGSGTSPRASSTHISQAPLSQRTQPWTHNLNHLGIFKYQISRPHPRPVGSELWSGPQTGIFSKNTQEVQWTARFRAPSVEAEVI